MPIFTMIPLAQHLISVFDKAIASHKKPEEEVKEEKPEEEKPEEKKPEEEKPEERLDYMNRDAALKARKETGLIYYTIASIASKFGDYEQGRPGRGIVMKKDYNKVMRRLIKSKNTNIKDPEYIEGLVENLYRALSPEEESECLNYHDILIGLGSMCCGSRDEKVEYIFEMITKDTRYAGLTLNNMIHYLNINYRVLFVTTPNLKNNYPVSEIELATMTAEELFINSSDVNQVITIEEFKKWYNTDTISGHALSTPDPVVNTREIEQAKYIASLEKKLEELERDYNKEWEDVSDNDSDYVPGG